MQTSKLTVIGLLICLSSIYFHDTYWLGLQGFESLPGLAQIGFPIGIIVTLIGLFAYKEHPTKSSNDNSDENDGKNISKVTCPNCGEIHDLDYPKCPHCKHQY